LNADYQREIIVLIMWLYNLYSVNVFQIGTIAGNLSIKHEHPEFPSDVFLILATVGATLTIGKLLNIS
jgi:hypothetical protein